MNVLVVEHLVRKLTSSTCYTFIVVLAIHFVAIISAILL